MEIINYLAVIALASLIHASFQLSVSVLTLLSGHSLSVKHSRARLLRMTGGFILGVAVITLLLLASATLIVSDIFGSEIPQIVWLISCLLLLALGGAIWVFYYRNQAGTTLWIPRWFADYLTSRTKRTRSSAEAFGLGLSSVIGELAFIVPPMFVSALILIQLPPEWQLIGLAIYVVVSMLSVFIIWILVARGVSLGRIQKWRETNKRFLQFSAGAGAIILGAFVYIVEVVSSVARLF